jgi:thymidylate synthase
VKIRASTLDDVLHEVFERLLRTGRVVPETTKGEKLGKTREASGVVIELTNPRARMSRTEVRHYLLFSCLGKLLWYLAGSDDCDFIRYYIPKYPNESGAAHLRDAYGPRLRPAEKDQLLWIVEILRKKPNSRRAVIPLYGIQDTHTDLSEVPCTCTLQFLLRGDRLELLAHMRSNDAYMGLPNDLFAFTMIQELIARSLGVEVGRYKHLVGSLHLYQAHWNAATKFLAEGWQRKHTMPFMPLGDQFESLASVLKLEKALRMGRNPRTPSSLPGYWRDIVQLLRIHKADRDDASSAEISRLRKGMSSDAYGPFIETKQRRVRKREAEQRAGSSGTLFPL